MSNASKFTTLKREAKQACIIRGHTMKRFVHGTPGKFTGWAYCKDCASQVWVTINPKPNDIDISGSAVAVNCIDEQRYYHNL